MLAPNGAEGQPAQDIATGQQREGRDGAQVQGGQGLPVRHRIGRKIRQAIEDGRESAAHTGGEDWKAGFGQGRWHEANPRHRPRMGDDDLPWGLVVAAQGASIHAEEQDHAPQGVLDEPVHRLGRHVDEGRREIGQEVLEVGIRWAKHRLGFDALVLLYQSPPADSHAAAAAGHDISWITIFRSKD